MHTVELLDQALLLAENLGYSVRQEWLGGRGGGPCELRGQKCLFVDLSLTPAEQLEQVSEALQASADVLPMPLPRELRKVIARRRSA